MRSNSQILSIIRKFHFRNPGFSYFLEVCWVIQLVIVQSHRSISEPNRNLIPTRMNIHWSSSSSHTKLLCLSIRLQLLSCSVQIQIYNTDHSMWLNIPHTQSTIIWTRCKLRFCLANCKTPYFIRILFLRWEMTLGDCFFKRYAFRGNVTAEFVDFISSSTDD